MKNLVKPLNAYFWLLIVFSFISPKTSYANTNSWIPSDTPRVQVDTISKKVINIYLTKGLEARKLVYVLRRQIVLDSQIIAKQDTIIENYKIINTELTESLKKRDQEIVKLIKREQRAVFWRKAWQSVSIALLGYTLVK